MLDRLIEVVIGAILVVTIAITTVTMVMHSNEASKVIADTILGM